jgi:hypothetical protein
MPRQEIHDTRVAHSRLSAECQPMQQCQLAHCRRQSDAGGARGSPRGTRRRAQKKTFAVLLDLGLGQQIEIGEEADHETAWPRLAAPCAACWRGPPQARIGAVEVTEDEDGEIMGFQQIATQ